MPRRWGLATLLALPALVILLGVALLVGGRKTSAWAGGAIDADSDGA